MKKTMRIVLSCLLCAALLASTGFTALAENGPYPEHFEEFYYARVEFLELDDKGEPVMVDNGEWTEQKTLPLYESGKAVAQEGAAYDLASNTLTLTDLKGNYMLRSNLMGDDFTVCVKGDCSLSSIVIYGGGEIQPKWGGSLRITGDGTLTVNESKLQESGILFYAQSEETAQLTVDPQVTLNVYGSRTAVEVYGYYGSFTMKHGSETVELKKDPAVRNVYVYLDGYSNPWEENIRLCRNAADQEGLYDMSVWYQDEAMTIVSSVEVDRYVYIEKYDLYLIDHAWAKKQSETGEVKFATVEEANAAGFTFLYEDDGSDAWLTVNSMGNYGPENAFQDAAGNRYVVDNVYDEDGRHQVALTVEPLEELPGYYLFLAAPDVDPDALTEETEDVVMENMYDYAFPAKELKYAPAAFLLGDVDQNGKVESADARLALRASVKLESYPDGSNSFLAADVDHNGKIESSDARSILRASVNLEKLA